jgi:hypothetical protein
MARVRGTVSLPKEIGPSPSPDGRARTEGERVSVAHHLNRPAPGPQVSTSTRRQPDRASRLERLQRVLESAAVCLADASVDPPRIAIPAARAMLAAEVVRLHDRGGVLTVTWRAEPDFERRVAFSSAWEREHEDFESVEHVTVGEGQS